MTDSINTVMICDTQPVTAEGLRTLLTGSPDLKFGGISETLGQATGAMRDTAPDLLIVEEPVRPAPDIGGFSHSISDDIAAAAAVSA